MNEDWLKDIQHKMADFEVDEPQGIWEEVYPESLKRMQKGDVERSRSFDMSKWKRIVSVAAIFAIIVTVCLFVYKDNNLTVSDISHKPSESKYIAENASVSESSSISIPNVEQSLITPAKPKSQKNTIIPIISYSKYTNSLPSSPISSSTSENINIFSSTSENNGISSSDTLQIKQERENPPLNFRQNYNHDLIAVNTFKGTGNSRLSVGIFSTSGTGSELSTKSMGTVSSTGVGPEFCDWIDSPLLGIMTYNRGLEVKDDIKHHLPLRTGVSFTYKLNDRFGIESGLTYSNLSSDIFQGSDSHYLEGKQTLHYVGIPLNLKINLFSWKNVDLYASTGATGEKCVAGNLKEKFVVNNETTKIEKTTIDEKPFQWSVNAAAGLQFNFSSLVGLYVEPGVSYYFDDGSSLKTIYKEKPLNFNLNLGIRLSL